MLIGISKFKFKDDFDRILVFFMLHSVLFICAKFYEFLRYDFGLLSFIGFALWCVFYRIFYRMVRFLYYSYWTMTVVSICGAVGGILASINVFDDASLIYLYFLSIASLVVTSYLLYTPIFYPIVSWWEYDFRYRNDIVTKVKSGDKEEKEGRLIDLRRGSGGLSYFEELKIGDVVILSPEFTELNSKLKAEIVSKRRQSIGRPYTYGLRFHFSTEEERRDFVKFQKFWQFERKHKQKAKFKSET